MSGKRVWKKRVFTAEQWARRLERQRAYRGRPDVRARLLPAKRAEMKVYYARNRERVIERVRSYRARNRERVLERKRAYHRAHREKQNARTRDYARAHPDLISRRNARYYVRNRGRLIAYQKAYQRANADKKLSWWHARRARVRGAAGRFTPEEFGRLVARFAGRCAYCGRPGPLTADHRIPLSRLELSPTNEISNILPACRSCNSSKGTKTEEEFREWLVHVTAPPATG